MQTKASGFGLVLLAAALALPHPAMAQAWLGQVVGEAAAGQQQAAQEWACRHATPLNPDSVKTATERAEKTMAAFFALTRDAKPKDIEAVFADAAVVTVRDGDTKVAYGDITAHLGPPPSDRRLVLAVVGGDNLTTRAIWSGQDQNGPVFYAADLRNGTWISGMSRILHLTIMHGATAPDTPPAYCHLSTDLSF